MFLPSSSPASFAAGPATTTITFPSAITPIYTATIPTNNSGSGKGGSGYPENWSSLIGIITAIVGNVLISFALNIQRYAHIRLEREWQEKEKLRKRRSRNRNRTSEESEEADADAKWNRPQHADILEDEREDQDGSVATESDPLLGGGQGRRRTVPTRTSMGSANTEEEGEEEKSRQKSYLKSPWWWAGIILMTTGEAGNFLAYGFAPASIVSPLGVVALISNCIIAPILLKEKFRLRDGLGVCVAVGGAVTVVLSASDNNPKLGPDEIWDMIRKWEFETYLGVTSAVIIALMVASNRFGEKSILIDLGLVGLFGKTPPLLKAEGVVADQAYRRLHGPLYQRRGVYAFVHTLARHHVSGHVSPRRYIGLHGSYADQVRQPRAAAVRCYAGHPCAVRAVHALRHPGFSNSISRL